MREKQTRHTKTLYSLNNMCRRRVITGKRLRSISYTITSTDDNPVTTILKILERVPRTQMMCVKRTNYQPRWLIDLQTGWYCTEMASKITICNVCLESLFFNGCFTRNVTYGRKRAFEWSRTHMKLI